MKRQKKNNTDCNPFDPETTLHCDTRSIVKLTDPDGKAHSEYHFHNEDKTLISVVKYDKASDINLNKQSDRLMLLCKNQWVFIVELKGSDFAHALKQLEQTLKDIKDKFNGWVFFCRIVLSHSRNIKLYQTDEKRLKMRLMDLNKTQVVSSTEIADIPFYKSRNSPFHEYYNQLEKDIEKYT